MMHCKIAHMIKTFLCSRFPRYKLWKITKAIGIKPYTWQHDYALGKTSRLGGGPDRATGKTMAVMLRILMTDYDIVKSWMFADDPDWLERDYAKVRWYIHEYRNLAFRCAAAGIPVPALPSPYPDRR